MLSPYQNLLIAFNECTSRTAGELSAYPHRLQMGFCLFSHPWDWGVSLRVTTLFIDLNKELPQSLSRSCFPLILTLELSIPPGILDDIETYLQIYVSSFFLARISDAGYQPYFPTSSLRWLSDIRFRYSWPVACVTPI